MFFKRIYDDDLAQASYLIACQTTGEMVVVDPRRDVQVYLDEAEAQGMDIVAVTETHIHADYLSGARELAAATGATLYLSAEGGDDWRYRFPHEPLQDGSEIQLGQITLTARHVPGHTPEHLAFLVTDGATTDQPGFILTGDFVFVGDVGRPDLLDEAAGETDTREPMARHIFASLRDVFLPLPDYLQVWPGHGAGSACGKALGAVASSTVGYEKRFAWWASYLAEDDETGFVKELLAGQPDAPHYFGRMKWQNRAGPAILGSRPPLKHFEPAELGEDAILLDTRPREAYNKGAVAGSLHLPAGKNFASRAAWLLDPEDKQPLVLLARDADGAAGLRDKLSRVGIDQGAGYVTSLQGLLKVPVPTITPQELAALPNPFILDVRTSSEYEAGHIPGAHQLPGGRVRWHLAELPNDRPIVSYCQSGARNAVVSSLLRAKGFEVLELAGSFQNWQATQAEVSSLDKSRNDQVPK